MITYESTGAVATITMDDRKVNALSVAMLTQLHEAFDHAEADGSAVVLTGRDGIFSAGFDLRVLDAGSPDVGPMIRAGFELGRRLLAFPRPVVAAAGGHTIAMGLFLLLACDHRMAVEGGEHRFTANEVVVGLPLPPVAVAICRASLAPGVLHRVLTLAEVFTPPTALAAGIVDELVPAADLLERAHARATALAALDAGAFAIAKRGVRGPALAEIDAAGRH